MDLTTLLLFVVVIWFVWKLIKRTSTPPAYRSASYQPSVRTDSKRYGTSGMHHSPLVGSVPYRSLLEKKAYEKLDRNKSVVYYWVEPFEIPYYDSRGRKRRYIPDLLVDYGNDVQHVVEIKPKKYIKGEELNHYKFGGARAYCERNGYEFRIWSENYIGR